MTNRTESIVASYVEGMKARYAWAQANDAVAERGLTMGADAARKACAGQLKLEGEAWEAAVRSAGYTGPLTKAGLAAFCAVEAEAL